MKRKLLFALLLWSLGGVMSVAQAAAAARIYGRNLASYQIVYAAGAEAEEGNDAAAYVQQTLQAATGIAPAICSDAEWKRGSAILLEHDKTLEPFGYSICREGRALVIRGGGCWAMQKAARMVAEELKEKGRIPDGYTRDGTVMGEHLFPIAEGANLRILDDNIWDYSSETIPEAWKPTSIDPRDDVRAPQFAQLVRAYMPDIVTLQEYSRHMHDRFYPRIQEYGYVISYESGRDWKSAEVGVPYNNPDPNRPLIPRCTFRATVGIRGESNI